MNNREAIYAGVGGGLLFGVIQSLTVGLAQGVAMGIFFGVAFGVIVRAFANSKAVQEQTRLPESLLLPGERVLTSKLANLVIRPEDFGLDDFAWGGLLWVVGMKKRESLGGALHLTNYRLLFKSHRYNRLRGLTSVFLPTIERLENRTVLVFRKLAVTTGTAKAELVVGEVDQLIAQIEAAREQLDAATITRLQGHVRNHPERCCDDLQPWTTFNRFNRWFNFGKRATSVTSAITSPLSTLGSMLVDELLDKTVTQRWQKVFEPSETTDVAKANERPAA